MRAGPVRGRCCCHIPIVNPNDAKDPLWEGCREVKTSTSPQSSNLFGRTYKLCNQGAKTLHMSVVKEPTRSIAVIRVKKVSN